MAREPDIYSRFRRDFAKGLLIWTVGMVPGAFLFCCILWIMLPGQTGGEYPNFALAGVMPCVALSGGAIGGLLALLLWAWVSRDSNMIGFCESCGFDMRATPQRCPECGAVPTHGSF